MRSSNAPTKTKQNPITPMQTTRNQDPNNDNPARTFTGKGPDLWRLRDASVAPLEEKDGYERAERLIWLGRHQIVRVIIMIRTCLRDSQALVVKAKLCVQPGHSTRTTSVCPRSQARYSGVAPSSVHAWLMAAPAVLPANRVYVPERPSTHISDT